MGGVTGARGRAQRPLGQPTRGKTASNRLRRVDNFLLLYDPDLLRRQDGPYAGAFFVDLGYGAEPVTTLESAQRLRRINPRLPVLGVEIDPERVAVAQPFADELTEFRRGGFNLPLWQRPDGSPESVRCIRAFNVLRQYEESAVAAAWAVLGSNLLPGGLLIEGTAEPFGRVWVANVLRRPHPGPLPGGEGVRPHPGPLPGGEGVRPHPGPLPGPLPGGEGRLVQEGLLFSTNFRLGFDPAEFQTVLPKNLIHRVTPGEPIYAFFAAWKRAALVTAPLRAFGLRQWFMASAEHLAARGYHVDLRRKLLAHGYFLVRGLEAGLSS